MVKCGTMRVWFANVHLLGSIAQPFHLSMLILVIVYAAAAAPTGGGPLHQGTRRPLLKYIYCTITVTQSFMVAA